jgi:hypothetical protein
LTKKLKLSSESNVILSNSQVINVLVSLFTGFADHMQRDLPDFAKRSIASAVARNLD